MLLGELIVIYVY